MKLKLKDEIVISLPDDLVRSFSRYYYPLNNTSADIFMGSMRKDSRKELAALCSAPKPDLSRISEICVQELQHCIALADTPADT